MAKPIMRAGLAGAALTLASVGALHAQSGYEQGDPAMKLFAGVQYGISSPAGGTVMTDYFPDGTCSGIQGDSRGQVRFKCRYEAKSVGQGRIALTIQVTSRPNMQPVTAYLRVLPNGNLFNEKMRAVAYRLDGKGNVIRR